MDRGIARTYVLLQPVTVGGSGFARLEQRNGRGLVMLRARLPKGQDRARILLLAGDAATGSTLDLGPLIMDTAGQGRLCRDGLPVNGGFGAYHTLAVAADWPRPALLLYGALRPSAAPPLWQIQEIIRRYLALPVDRPAPQAESAQPMSSSPPASVQLLPRLQWPRCMSEVAKWFATLPPAAPFDDPGWRFVEVRLPPGSPAPCCMVGIQPRGGRIAQVTYALPGPMAPLPPGGLQGYRWTEGRHHQGYWVQTQTLPERYAAIDPQEDVYRRIT